MSNVGQDALYSNALYPAHRLTKTAISKKMLSGVRKLHHSSPRGDRCSRCHPHSGTNLMRFYLTINRCGGVTTYKTCKPSTAQKGDTVGLLGEGNRKHWNPIFSHHGLGSHRR